MTDILESDTLKTMGQVRSITRNKKSSKLYKWSREGVPNPLSPSGLDEGGCVFHEEMLELAPLAKNFATGPEVPIEDLALFLLYDLQAESLNEVSVITGAPCESRLEVSCPLPSFKGTWVRWAYPLWLEVGGRGRAVH